jgi:hypothetical protein
MKKTYLFPVLILAVFLAVGCSEKKESLSSPTAATANAGRYTYVVDNTGAIYFVRVTVGTITILCRCDYPWDSYGPYPDGHCAAPGPDYPRDYVSGRLVVGQVYRADNDSVLLHKSPVTPIKAGDPTGDDK